MIGADNPADHAPRRSWRARVARLRGQCAANLAATLRPRHTATFSARLAAGSVVLSLVGSIVALPAAAATAGAATATASPSTGMPRYGGNGPSAPTGPPANRALVQPSKALGPIVPPDDPPANEVGAVCYGDDATGCLAQINTARADQEGLAALVLPTNWSSLSGAEQLFVFTDLERVSRGEPAIPDLVNSQHTEVQQAVTDDADPEAVDGLGSWGSIWAGGVATVVDAFGLWMYDDGPGGTNEDCATPDDPGCWGHRNIILANSLFIGDPGEMDAVAGTDSHGNTSYAALFMVWTGDAPIFTWADGFPYLAGPSLTTTSLPDAQVGSAYSATLAAHGGTTPYTWSVTAGSLPQGLSLASSTGKISGVPTTSGDGSLTVKVTDHDGHSGSGEVSMVVLSQPSGYYPISPTRICDTRAQNPSGLSGPAAQCSNAMAGTTLSADRPQLVTVSPDFGVPADATEVVVNITVVNPASKGYLTVYPGGGNVPTASTVNFSANQVVADLAEVALGTGGAIAVMSNASTDVLIDLEGYGAPSGVGGSLYHALGTPTRICDTRPNNPSGLSGQAAQCDDGTAGSTLAAGTPRTLQVAGVGGVPASDITAVVVNVTASGPRSQGYLSVYPDGDDAPTASNVNFRAGQPAVPNRVIVPVGADGQIDLVSNVAVDAIVDISGWFSTAPGSGASFTPEQTPIRICDTRAGNPSGLSGPEDQCGGNGGGNAIGPHSTLTITVAGIAGMPAGATAAVLTVTAISPSAQSYLSVFPGASAPTISDLNPAAGEVEANFTVATLSGAGTITIFNHSGSTNVIVDLTGWYQ